MGLLQFRQCNCGKIWNRILCEQFVECDTAFNAGADFESFDRIRRAPARARGLHRVPDRGEQVHRWADRIASTRVIEGASRLVSFASKSASHISFALLKTPLCPMGLKVTLKRDKMFWHVDLLPMAIMKMGLNYRGTKVIFNIPRNQQPKVFIK